MDKKINTDYSDCRYLINGRCKPLKDTYCRKQPEKLCAFYKSKYDEKHENDKNFYR